MTIMVIEVTTVLTVLYRSPTTLEIPVQCFISKIWFGLRRCVSRVERHEETSLSAHSAIFLRWQLHLGNGRWEAGHSQSLKWTEDIRKGERRADKMMQMCWWVSELTRQCVQYSTEFCRTLKAHGTNLLLFGWLFVCGSTEGIAPLASVDHSGAAAQILRICV